MTTLTVQFKHIKKGWEDQTVVTVFNPEVLNQEVTTLQAELPKDISARVKIDNAGKVSYAFAV